MNKKEIIEELHENRMSFGDTKNKAKAAAIKLIHELSAKVEELENSLNAQYAAKANEKFRADQMSQQHSMQAALNKEAREKLADLELVGYIHPQTFSTKQQHQRWKSSESGLVKLNGWSNEPKQVPVYVSSKAVRELKKEQV